MSVFLTKVKKNCQAEGVPAMVEPFWKYVEEGDEKSLETMRSLVPKHGTPWMYEVWKYLPAPEKLTAEEKRVMHAATLVRRTDEVAGWVREGIAASPEKEEAYLAAYLEACGTESADRVRAAAGLLEGGPEIGLVPEADPNGVEAFLLSLTDAELAEVAGQDDRYHWLLRLLLQRAPERAAAVCKKYLLYPRRDTQYLNCEACELLLEYDAGRYENVVAKAFCEEATAASRFRVGVALTALSPEKYREETAAIARNTLTLSTWFHESGGMCEWLAEQFGVEALEEVTSCLKRTFHAGHARHILSNIVSILGRETRPAVIAAMENPYVGPRRVALEQLVAWGEPSDRELIRSGFERGVQDDDRDEVVRYAKVAAGALPELEDLVWKLLKHKSQLVRDAAARTLGRLGDACIPEASKLLVAKSATARSSAVKVLRASGTPAAYQLLEGRLDLESDEEVRDLILLSLEFVWEAEGRTITPGEIEKRMERIADRLQGPVAAWLNEPQLAPLCYAEGGTSLSPVEVRYLLYRQSRAKEMQVDVEARPLLALIDRGSSGDFALAVLKMFLGGDMDSRDRWAMVIAGVLGDDRIVPPLMQQIRAWVDGRRGKMAEYATQALALLGTDMALASLDSLSMRYRNKQRNIGRAASEAFADAARRLGVTLDELGDRVVPWLGFKPGQPRILEEGGRRLEVGIGLDFKLAYTDLEKGKKIRSLPGVMPAAVKAEYKELAALIREVVKGQLVRVENLMVRQFRWSAPRWRELYGTHPLLFPFAVQLVWGVYGEDGGLLATFRALEDRTFTGADDEAFEIPDEDGVTIGMVHPLELTKEQRDRWSEHLVDYKIEPPFPQIHRPVVFVSESERELRLSKKYCGTEIAMMTFRSRAERHGWQRGLVCESGTIWCYHKSFAGAGVDAMLELEGFYVEMDMYSEISLEKFYFVRAGRILESGDRGEPLNADDERLIPFGDVPPVVYSETVSDLERIAQTMQEGE